jgi:hypothetical protein
MPPGQMPHVSTDTPRVSRISSAHGQYRQRARQHSLLVQPRGGLRTKLVTRTSSFNERLTSSGTPALW